MQFYPVDDLKNDEIFLRLDHTCEAQPEKRWLPAYYFNICLTDGTKVGYCDLRIGHNDKTYIGGNIGYGIDEAYRGHHYAARACALLFRQARKHQMDYVIITCDPANRASARTCELAGGRYLETALIPEDNEMYAEGKRQVMIWRFDLEYAPAKEIEILGANRFETFTKTREGSRAVIMRDGMILLSHETISGWWLVPGGGLEPGETPEECCVRETEEETGVIVRPLQHFLTLYEYYEEYRYISYYFVCGITGAGRMRLTEAEVQRGLEPQWLPLGEAVELFSRHQSYADSNEEKRGSYLREYTALQEYLKLLGQE